MRMVVLGLSVLVWTNLALADEPASPPSAVNDTIRRGLGFLTKDSLAWKQEHNCVSCHHAGLVVWAMHEAKQRGFDVDETVLADLTKWMVDAGDGKTSVPRPAGRPKALNTKALYFSQALEANPRPDAASQVALMRFLNTVREDQTDDGSWSAWPESRPPMFGGSDVSMTALATLTLLPAAAAGDESAKAARDKGVQWLAATKSDEELQSISMRLVLWQRLGRPAVECESLLKHLQSKQNADGGWGQTKEMPSDAWATGQAIYALSHAGLKPDDVSIARARDFLVRTQRHDGSWSMTSRPAKPGGEGAQNLIPITGAGSAWAVIGLARSR